jgi:hypothetical protein
MHDSGFCVFCGYVSMARSPKLNGCFQMCNPFVHMRGIVLGVRSCIVHETEPRIALLAHLLPYTSPDQPPYRTTRSKTRYRESLVFLDQNDMKSLALDQSALAPSKGSERTDDRRPCCDLLRGRFCRRAMPDQNLWDFQIVRVRRDHRQAVLHRGRGNPDSG